MGGLFALGGKDLTESARIEVIKRSSPSSCYNTFMQHYIIDTNFFFNLEINTDFGKNAKENISQFSILAEKIRKAGKAQFYMPPRILEEFFTFVDRSDKEIQNFLSNIIVKAPHRDNLNFPADIFYDLVEEMRHRAYRGLQVSEDELGNAAKDVHLKSDLDRIAYQKTFGEHVTRLRDRYRMATRSKFLDSVADLDLILLTKELGGILISADEGVIRWGRRFGVREVMPQFLKSQLEPLLSENE